MAAPDGVYPFDTFESAAFGRSYTVTVSEEVLAKSPRWLDEAENPPVAVRAALRSASTLADRLVGTKAGYTRYLEGICLQPLKGHWIWVVRFDWISRDAATGVPPHIIIVVPMDGKPLSPEIKELGKSE